MNSSDENDCLIKNDSTTTNSSNSNNRQRTKDVTLDESNSVEFSEMMLSQETLDGLKQCGFIKPSPIQVQAIPLALTGRDIIAQAKSGTGKTVVFSVVALETVLKLRTTPIPKDRQELLDMDDESYAAAISGVPRHPVVMILSPTREIAVQSCDVVNQLARSMKYIKAASFIGGLREVDDRHRLSGCQIVVGTPGRIRSLIESLTLRTDDIKLLILDEADKLLDMGFSKDINWLHRALPVSQRQTLALSATYPVSVLNVVKAYMRADVMEVRVGSDTPSLTGITQYYQFVENPAISYQAFKEKIASLLLLLEQLGFYQAIVFVSERQRAEEVCKLLVRRGWPTRYIAGAMEQRERLLVMEELKDFKLRILVSTDLIARGIDIERVNLVVNIDMPRDYETYFHRIGRTGRFGTYGVSVSFISKDSEQDRNFLHELRVRYNVELLERKDNDEIPEHFYTYQLSNSKESESLESLKLKQQQFKQKQEEKEQVKLLKQLKINDDYIQNQQNIDENEEDYNEDEEYDEEYEDEEYEDEEYEDEENEEYEDEEYEDEEYEEYEEYEDQEYEEENEEYEEVENNYNFNKEVEEGEEEEYQDFNNNNNIFKDQSQHQRATSYNHNLSYNQPNNLNNKWEDYLHYINSYSNQNNYNYSYLISNHNNINSYNNHNCNCRYCPIKQSKHHPIQQQQQQQYQQHYYNYPYYYNY
ncbi:putative RNA helicase [Heterostelium album PN500]|uniref:Putative RNA helicase n=1 Tax=Heterostelium pallidum (strain ATCC 26659 / Pp 5 / PN500) TaxID=670386 RepID=D3BRI1_HETP5|nr:putative RNA helicase [Heterostelium album PN500]EFA76013.1 putative RNA helicase [Heterostelium album PN500]|eukprot:XP_020428147.1 putative RNA helicase [Heterostelium album PN500]